jgi:hypothetical protein
LIEARAVALALRARPLHQRSLGVSGPLVPISGVANVPCVIA